MALLRDARGMTLIEVMIAITILVVGILALMNTVTTGYLDVAFSGGESTATAAARQLFEQLKNQPFHPNPWRAPRFTGGFSACPKAGSRPPARADLPPLRRPPESPSGPHFSARGAPPSETGSRRSDSN